MVGKVVSKKGKEDIDCKPCKPSAVIGLVVLFLVGLILLNTVNVGQGFVTGHATQTSFISELFTEWTAGDLDVNIAKYLLFGILTLFIWGALNYVKVPKSTAVQWILAIPISFLTVAYITPEELFVALTGYTALGLTLTTIIPFVIMLFFSAMLLGNERIKSMTVGKVMLEIMLWGFFVAFLIYKLIVGYTGVDRPIFMLVIVWIILGLSLLILVFNKNFRKWVMNLGIELKKAKADAAAAVVESQKEIGKSMITGPTAEEIAKFGGEE